MKQVTKDEFWEFVMGADFNILSRVDGPYPYTSTFSTVGRMEVGKIVESYAADRIWPTEKKYFLVTV